MKYEWNFVDGPGKDRVVLNDEAPKVLFLCNRLNHKWWTFREPERMCVEATYKRLGNAPRLEGPTLILYGVTDEFLRAEHSDL